jgi:aspartyl-tRNA(Asn)/glutamyl-tRNA(Gln) amidotransferase subunit C
MVDKKTVKYVANLARIEILVSEIDFFGEQLSKILDYIDKLKELDVDGIEAMRGLHLENNIFRKDETIKFPFKEDILKNSPLREGDYFKIQKVIE